MIVEIITFVFIVFILFLTISIIHALKNHKQIKSKEEFLFFEKNIFTASCSLIYCILCAFTALEITINDSNGKSYIAQAAEYSFNVYIILLYSVNLFISIELYCSYKSPIHYYLTIFKQKTRIIYQICFVVLSILVLVYNILDPFNERYEVTNKGKNDFGTPFFILDKSKWAIILIFNLTVYFFYVKLGMIIAKFNFNKKEKLIAVIKKKFIANILYTIYAAYNGLVFGYMKESKEEDYETVSVIGSFLFLCILTGDTIIELFIFSTTKFAQYKLRKTIIGYFSDLFPNDFGNDKDPATLVDSIKIPNLEDSDSSEGEEDDDDDGQESIEVEAEQSLIAKNPVDTELVEIFKNNIFIEDYFLSFCDQYLNLVTASLYKMYNSKLFSTREANSKKLKEEINVSLSGIGDGRGYSQVSKTAELSGVTSEGGTSAVFSIRKDKHHFPMFKDILGHGKDNEIKIEISSYYTNACVFNILNSNLNSKNIAKSLISHFIVVPKKEDKDNPNPFYSLVSANAKGEYFRYLNNISFKSYDKNFNLDFFETDDQEIAIENKSNKDIALMINKYFEYIEGQGKTGSFLPVLIGVFKIKINTFKTMLIYVTRNVLVEDVPKNFFSYWQLLRFNTIKPAKLASSKYRGGTLVQDDPLFERPYKVETKKDDANFNKVLLKNINEFKDIIANDLHFLEDINCSHSNLLMMYYEYENTQKHEEEGAIKIRKTDANEAEIIAVDMPKDSIEDNKNENEIKTDSQTKEEAETEKDTLNLNDDINTPLSKKKDEFGEDDIFADDGEIFDTMPDNRAVAKNLMEFSEQLSINGYEGLFDNFNCLCFFTFENVFDVRKKLSAPKNHYNNFQKKLLQNFAEYKLNKN